MASRYRQCVIFLVGILFLPTTTSAEEGEFVPLVGIPFIETTDVLSLGDYVNALYLAAISIAAFLAVVKIIFAGVQYMLSEVVTNKEQAKKSIYGAIVGLLIVLGAFLILNTINPQLTGLTNLDGPTSFQNLESGGVDITVVDYPEIPIDQPITQDVLNNPSAARAIQNYIANCQEVGTVVINNGMTCNIVNEDDTTEIEPDPTKTLDEQQSILLEEREAEGFVEILNTDIDINTTNVEEVDNARKDCQRRGGDEFFILNHSDDLGRIFCFQKQ